jgi:hypothetical protein
MNQWKKSKTLKTFLKAWSKSKQPFWDKTIVEITIEIGGDWEAKLIHSHDRHANQTNLQDNVKEMLLNRDNVHPKLVFPSPGNLASFNQWSQTTQ